MKQSRFIQIKKKHLGKDTLRVSEAAIQRYSVKKAFLKNLPPVYLHVIEIDIGSRQRPVKICKNPDNKKIALFSIFKSEQVLYSADESIKVCWNGFY